MGAGHVVGGLRVEGSIAAPPPYPASPLVAAARLAPSRWRFAAADGTIYESPSFLGALRRVGAAPTALLSPATRRGACINQRESRGALVYVGEDGAAWVDDGAAPARRIPARGVTHAIAVSAQTVLVAATPGVLLRSTDGGRTVTRVELAAGAARDVGFDALSPFVRTSDGDLRLIDGRWTRERVEAPEPRNRLENVGLRSSPLPDRASHVAALDAQLAVLRGREVELWSRDLRARQRTIPAPGEDCALYGSSAGLYASCLHDGWARSLSRLDASRGSWSLLRDEARAQPMGELYVDAMGGGYVVRAPCEQRPTPDPTRVCLVDRSGTPHEFALPFEVALRGMSDGAALALEAHPRPSGPARAARITARGFTPLTLAMNEATARSISLGSSVFALERPSPDEPARALLHAPWSGAPLAWRRSPVPPGTTRVARSLHDGAITLGADVGSFARLDEGGRRLTLPSPIDGDPRALRIDPRDEPYCVARWCRLGATLTLAFDSRVDGAPLLAREEVPPPAPTVDPPRPLRVRCVDEGAAVAAEELDRGVAIAGYALRTAWRGEEVEVEWFGPRMRHRARARWPGERGEVSFALGAVGAVAPGALLGRCSAGRCEHALIDGAGMRAVSVPVAPPGAVALFAHGAGWTLRADEERDGERVVRVIDVPAREGDSREGVFSLGRPAQGVDVGALDGEAGVWVRESPSRLRFYDLRGEARGEVTEERAGCARREPPRGVIRRTRGAADVQGEGWRVEDGEWILEETLHVYGGAACVAAIAGGEPREEPPEGARPRRERREVRTFVLRAEGRDALVGHAWGGRREYAQRCGLSP